MPSRLPALLLALAIAGPALAGGPLQDLEMDVMEAGETPARAVARIAPPPGVAAGAEAPLIETGRLGATEVDDSRLRPGAMDSATEPPALGLPGPGEPPGGGAGD